MPFTGSHPAAILPLMRWGLPPSALVIGSMAPDIPFYAPVPIVAGTTHTVVAALGVDVLLGLVVFAVWQVLVGPAVTLFMPALRRRLPGPVSAGLVFHTRTVARVLRVMAALALGSVTHVCWDSMTHPGTWGATHLPWLARSYGPLPGYEWNQYLSGVVGIVALAIWCRWWWCDHPALITGTAEATFPARRTVTTAWSVLGLAALAGGAYRVVSGRSGEVYEIRGTLFLATTGAWTAGWLVAMLLSSAWFAWHCRAAVKGHPQRWPQPTAEACPAVDPKSDPRH